jgi:hypothetical protein
MAMGLPPVTSAVLLIAKLFLVKRGCFGEISEMSLLPLRGSSVSGKYVCNIYFVWLVKPIHLIFIDYQSANKLWAATTCHVCSITGWLRRLVAQTARPHTDSHICFGRRSRRCSPLRVACLISILLCVYFSVCVVWCPGQNKRIAPLSFLDGCRKRRLKD